MTEESTASEGSGTTTPPDEATAAILESMRLAVASALDRKASEVNVLSLAGLSQVADYFILCSGNNPRQVQAISDAVERKLRDHGNRPRHIEGYRRGRWILLDYLDFVLHVFHEEERAFYALDRLWGDAPDITDTVLPEDVLPEDVLQEDSLPEGTPIESLPGGRAE